MPELPEVETIKRGLEKKIIGKTIINIDVLNPGSFWGQKDDLLNQKVIGVERRAKTLRLLFSNDTNLLFHLKMTGQLIVIDNDSRFAGGHPSHDWHANLPNSHTRIIFVFDNNIKLFFNDLRKFGWAKVMNSDQIEETFQKYGPEPFSEKFSTKYLLEKAKRFPKRTTKQFIMDQSIIAGVGNIYADESLFLSKIMPKTTVGMLSEKEIDILRKNIIRVLELGIIHGGTTDSDYVNIDGEMGGMQDYLNVYHKTGEKCPNKCGGLIDRMVIGGRGTNFCPNCQKEVK